MKRVSRILCLALSLITIFSVIPVDITASAVGNTGWSGSWGSPAVDSGITLGEGSLSEEGINLKDVIPANSTVRTVITPTLGGTKIKLKFSNYFSEEKITINETTIANTGKTDDLVEKSSITQVTFNGGQKSVTIAPGSEVYSDEITFKTTALKKVSVSSYFKNTTTMHTTGLYGGTSYLCSSLGNRTHTESVTALASKLVFTAGSISYYTIPFLTRLDVYAPGSYSVVLLGDSTITNDVYLMLAEKAIANGVNNIGFVMSGIIGNCLLSDGHGLLGTIYGQAILTRAKRDAFNVAGVKYVIVKIGDNDILHPMLKSNAGMAQTTPSQVINGYKQLAQQAKDSGIKLYLCTRTPYKGYTRNFLGSDDLEWTQNGENMLLEINSWVKNLSSNYGFSGYINLDAMRDTKDSTKLRSQMTTDGIHFSQLGQIAFTDLIPESAYGVNKELKNYASIVNKDPYKAPVTNAVSTTKKPTENSTKKDETTTINNNSSSNETTTVKNNSGTVAPITDETTTFTSIVVTPETTTTNANQILIDDGMNNQGVIGSVSDSSSSTKQMAGFAILATIAVAIIAVSAVMLTRLNPSKSAPLTRIKSGRATKKKKV